MNTKTPVMLVLTLIFALIMCGAASADDYVGGQPLTTVQNGTVSGGVYSDTYYGFDGQGGTGNNNGGTADITYNFQSLPSNAQVTNATLYVAVYCGHMQNNYKVNANVNFNGNTLENSTDIQQPYTFIYDGGNDNTGQGGGTGEPYKIINNHTIRVTSDYLMKYDVTSLIQQNNTIRVFTTGSFDGRIKLISLIAAYNDGDSDQIKYWINYGQDIASYQQEDYFGEVYVGSTNFATSNTTGVESANLKVIHMSSNNGYYGFPSAANDFNLDGSVYPAVITGSFTNQTLDRSTPDVQASYSGSDSWDVSSSVNGSSDTSLGFTRYFEGGTGLGGYYKIAFAILTAKLESTPAPIAGFTSNVTSGLRPLTVQFTDQSTDATGWSWDFNNDGTTDSTAQNPSWTYDTAGTYNVKLAVTGPGGSDEEIKTNYITVNPNVNLNIGGVVNTVPASAVFAREPNTIRIMNVRNQGTDTATNIVVYVFASDVSDTVPVATTTIASLAGGAQTTIDLIDPTIRNLEGGTVTYTAKLDPDNLIVETNEADNTKASAGKPLKYNGYKGKRYWDGGSDITTKHVFDLRGDIVYYTQPSTFYKGVGWTDRTETWTAANLPIPDGATVEKVLLFFSYNWDQTDGGYPNLITTFNGNTINLGTPYRDWSNFGAYADYEYGLYPAVDVTSLFVKNGENTLITNPGNGGADNKVALYPSTLAVIFSDPTMTRKVIYINEECDELGVSLSSYATTMEEATAYAVFNGINTTNVSAATLHSFAGSGGPDEGNILWNGNTIASLIWQGNSSTASAAVVDVLNYLATNNEAGIQGTTSGGMDALQQFLIIEYADQPPVADFSGTPVSGDAPLTVQFTDQSTNATSWSWDFNNDGTVDSTEHTPEWTYQTPGTYTVKLTVSNSAGSDEEVKTGYITVNGMADLIVTAINPNVGAGEFFFANEPNVISVTVKNNGTLASLATTVDVDVNGTIYSVNVPALDAGASTTVTVTDTANHTGGSSVPVNANANPDRNIPEANTNNNSLSINLTVSNNGYKGKQYTDDDEHDSIDTKQTFNGKYDVIYSNGDAAYRGSGSTWANPYTASWTSTDLPIPAGATVVSARLYQSYTWNALGGIPDFVASFNGNLITALAHYSDTKGHGTYDYPAGLLIYDVTSFFNKAGNTLTLTNGTTTGANTALYGSYLIVVYQDPNTAYKKIYINDGADMLYSGTVRSVSDEEGTAHAKFNDVNTSGMVNAQVIAILASANEEGKSKFFFNGQEYTDFSGAYNSTSQIGFSIYDVTNALIKGLNTADLQSFMVSGNGDNMVALGSILITTLTDTTAPTVSASPAGGLYKSPLNVTLTATDDQDADPKIYYTLDGTTPTTTSTLYTGPILINATTLKFIAVDGSDNTSPVQTETYTIDTVVPTITSTDPANNKVINVANKAIVITFSENIKEGSAFSSIKVTNPDGVRVNPLYKVINGKTLTLTRNGNYINGLTYTITLPTGSITDTAGNAITAFTSKFTVDFAKPTITSVNPANNKVINVANKALVITFSEAIKAGSAFTSIKVTNPDGVKVKPLYKVINGKTLTLTRNGNYINGLTYTITLPTGSITDTAGNNINTYTSKFTVDFAKPTITSVNPANNKVINVANKALVITFSEAIKAGSAFTSIKVTNPDGVKVNPLYKVINGKTLTLTRNGNYINGLTYTITLPTGSITDTAGNTINTYTSKFKVDTTKPKITSVNPANNKVINVVNKAIVITFSENIKAGSAFTSIKVTNPDGVKVNPLYKVINGKTLTLTRNGNYLNRLTYTIILPKGSITDTAGNTINTYTSKFTIRKT